jgi:hypothetical protein
MVINSEISEPEVLVMVTRAIYEIYIKMASGGTKYYSNYSNIKAII